MENEFEDPTLPQSRGASHLRHYWHVLYERRWWMITTFIVVFALMLIYLFRYTPIYRATATIEIGRVQNTIVNLGGQPLSLNRNFHDSDYLETQYEKLLSRSLIERVVRKLRLDMQGKYAEAAGITNKISTQDTVRAVMPMVRGDISINPSRLSRLVEIHVEHTEGESAKEIANTLVELFLDIKQERRRNRYSAPLNWLNRELTIQENKVSEAAEKIHNFEIGEESNGENPTQVSFDDELATAIMSLQQAQTAYEMKVSEINDLEEIVTNATKAKEKGEEVQNVVSSIANKHVIASLKSSLSVAETRLEGFLERYREDWPAVLQIKKEIQEFRNQIKREAESAIEAMNKDLEIARNQEKQASNRLNLAKERLHKLNKRRVEYSMLKRAEEKEQAVHDMLLARAKEMQLVVEETRENIYLVDPAIRPIIPAKPNKTLLLIVGIVGGIIFGVGLAFLVNLLDDSIKTQDDIETYLRLDYLGHVPRVDSKISHDRSLYAYLQPQSDVSENFRTIRATVALADPEKEYRVVSITSAAPSEGKSFIASNYAIVNAQMGLKTLLIDCDLRRPSLRTTFEFEKEQKGLTQYIESGGEALEDIIHRTEIPDLDLIHSGKISKNPHELVTSDALKKLIAEVEKKYDRVVIDSPPILAVSDPLIIASLADGLLYVTKFDRSKRHLSKKCIEQLQNGGANIIGAIINEVDLRKARYSYYYNNYYYQNRYYTDYYRKHREKKAS